MMLGGTPGPLSLTIPEEKGHQDHCHLPPVVLEGTPGPLSLTTHDERRDTRITVTVMIIEGTPGSLSLSIIRRDTKHLSPIIHDERIGLHKGALGCICSVLHGPLRLVAAWGRSVPTGVLPGCRLSP